jgi:hypothetical protein
MPLPKAKQLVIKTVCQYQAKFMKPKAMLHKKLPNTIDTEVLQNLQVIEEKEKVRRK